MSFENVSKAHFLSEPKNMSNQIEKISVTANLPKNIVQSDSIGPNFSCLPKIPSSLNGGMNLMVMSKLLNMLNKPNNQHESILKTPVLNEGAFHAGSLSKPILIDDEVKGKLQTREQTSQSNI
mmetsp:Transcript_389/g.415  ORF Transcript_389/g.415 Transcript_389/m.415 type:complete len:123 (+) Transcript_389:306-674(+)